MSKPVTVNIAQLRAVLGRITHATPFSATTLVDARAKKTDNPFGPAPIRKLTRINGMIGSVYELSVNRQMVREGNGDAPAFEAQPRKWGKRIAPALVVNDAGDQFYMPAQLNPSLKPKPLYLIERAQKTGSRLVAVSKETVAPWLPADRSAETAVAQNVERPVIYRDYALSSIVALSLNGLKYRVR